MKKIIQISLLTVVSTVFLLGSAAAQTGNCAADDYDCQIAENTKRVNTSPKDIEAYYNLGAAYNKAKKHTEAINNLNKYIALKPEKPEYLADGYFERGYAYLMSNSLDSAITDYNAGLLISPQKTTAYINRGLAYYRKNDYPKATADFTKAKQINPDDAEAYYNLGLIFEKKAEYAKAIAEFDKYISLNTANKEYLADGYSERGKTYFVMGSNAKAIADLTSAIETFPDKPAYYIARARVYRKQGKIALAAADEQEAASLKK